MHEEMGAIPGSRLLNKLELDLLHDATVGSFDRDDDFSTFIAIDSETDHLPIDLELLKARRMLRGSNS